MFLLSDDKTKGKFGYGELDLRMRVRMGDRHSNHLIVGESHFYYDSKGEREYLNPSKFQSCSLIRFKFNFDSHSNFDHRPDTSDDRPF